MSVGAGGVVVVVGRRERVVDMDGAAGSEHRRAYVKRASGCTLVDGRASWHACVDIGGRRCRG